MRYLSVLVCCLLFSVQMLQAQKPVRKTFLSVLTNLSAQLHKDLSYSADLVMLNDSTDFVFSSKPDSCMAQISRLTGYLLSVTDHHLLIYPESAASIHLHGIVRDAKTGDPLPYCHLLIKNAGTGTITNKDGLFDFRIRRLFAGGTIEFSFLGYNHQEYIIPETSPDSLLIELEPKPYTLGDIYVLPNGMQPVDIVEKAVKNIKRNYHKAPAQLDAFFRSSAYRDSSLMQLIEAALLIHDKGILHPANTTAIQLQQVRKSANYLEKEDVRWEVLDKMFGHSNLFYRPYAQNMVRNYRDSWWYKPLTDYDRFKYDFEGFEWLDSVKVYKIRFTYDYMIGDENRKSQKRWSDDGGYIYINADDWAILKIEQWWKLGGEKPFGKNGFCYMSKKEIVYQKIGDKYYLKYVRTRSAPDGAIFVYDQQAGPDGKKKIVGEQWADLLLLVTNVITDKKEFDRIRYKERLARDENSFKKVYPYDAGFWNNYNVLKENPIGVKEQKEIEWEKTLKQQFEENSSDHAGNN